MMMMMYWTRLGELEFVLSNGGVYNARTGWAPVVLLLRQPIRSWRWRDGPMNTHDVRLVTGSIFVGQLGSVQFSSRAVNKPLCMGAVTLVTWNSTTSHTPWQYDVALAEINISRQDCSRDENFGLGFSLNVFVSFNITGARFTKYLTIYHKIILSLS